MEAKYKIHAFYILLILITTIILLLTKNFGSIPSLFQYITFALTLSSITLAFIAIVYSFISNTSLSKIIATVLNASESISESASGLQSTTKNLDTRISLLPPILEKVYGKFEETTQILKEQSKTITPSTAGAVDVTQSKESAEKFLEFSSLAGLQALYACTLVLLKLKLDFLA